MDNLQEHYLHLLATAHRKALAGDTEACRDICFDLRQMPDLALYTRAMVYMMICDISHASYLPEKVEMAEDALRIAKELIEEKNSQKNAVWTVNYNDLLQQAEEAVEIAKKEENEIVLKETDDSGKITYSLSPSLLGLSSPLVRTESTMRSEEDNSSTLETEDELAFAVQEDEEEYRLPPEHENEEFLGMPMIEGAFTLFPSRMTASSSATLSPKSEASDISHITVIDTGARDRASMILGDDSDAEMSDDSTAEGGLPDMAPRLQGMSLGADSLPTPEPSSRLGSEEPEERRQD